MREAHGRAGGTAPQVERSLWGAVGKRTPAAVGLQLLSEDFDLSIPPKTEALEDDNPRRRREIPPEKPLEPPTLMNTTHHDDAPWTPRQQATINLKGEPKGEL